MKIRRGSFQSASGVLSNRTWIVGLVILGLAYAHHTVPYLTMMPRVNVDEPWLIERAFQVLHTGRPNQPMLGLDHAYLLQPGYGYLVAPWIGLFGVGIYQARLLSVILGLGVVLAVVGTGARLVDRPTGLLAGVFLLSDSNFLGGARMARTDIPAVFFIALALWLFVAARDRQRSSWYAASGLSTAAAILCHGNSFWLAVILAAWYFIEYRLEGFTRASGYAYAAGLLAGLAPYLAVVVLNWHEVAVQIASFAGDRVPGWRPSFVLQQIMLEPQRYRDWYFGLVTDTVRNPLLRTFQLAILIGVARLVFVAVSRHADARARRSAVWLLVLSCGSAVIFAAFINNKALVYMPHLLLGFSLVAGYGASWGARLAAGVIGGVRRGARVAVATVAMVLVATHAIAGVAYYEKWYRLTRRTELLPYESTERTIARMLPSGPKYVYAAAQFWMPFAGQRDVVFFSHAAPAPVGTPGHMWLTWVRDSRPLFLLIDERQWEPELIAPANDPKWQQPWIAFITQQCRLRSYAPGSSFGTLAAFECARDGAPPSRDVVVASDAATYTVEKALVSDGAAQLSSWSPSAAPWAGIERTVRVTPGTPYLLTADVDATTSGDLVYIGRWSPPEVTSLS
ncbi:MAG TPA: glycosyltransferase family 39 protein, partial [Vicinamibacterales bacterium]|nr:glycosyltransferase family 39 protein [Vicinamibacterales bacterium]